MGELLGWLADDPIQTGDNWLLPNIILNANQCSVCCCCFCCCCSVHGAKCPCPLHGLLVAASLVSLKE